MKTAAALCDRIKGAQFQNNYRYGIPSFSYYQLQLEDNLGVIRLNGFLFYDVIS
jgi:hypothetical protein